MAKIDERSLNAWEEFSGVVKELEFTAAQKRKSIFSEVSPFLYRGQPNAKWGLKTTLERVKGRISCKEYHTTMRHIQSRIEAEVDKRWASLKEFVEPDLKIFADPDATDFMIYLRHHQFPSPLLDWTMSPYIAAFFAFRSLADLSDRDNPERVAIYCYQECVGAGKESVNNPIIHTTLYHNVKGHKRHYSQQSQYTICRKEENGQVFYENHEDAIESNNSHYDRVIKITIPFTERNKALADLNQYNISAFSLFHSEEALMHSVAVNEFIIEQ